MKGISLIIVSFSKNRIIDVKRIGVSILTPSLSRRVYCIWRKKMLKGLQHLQKIQQLSTELVSELEALRQGEEEHREEYRSLQNQLIDLDHIPEMISLSGSESAKFVRKMRESMNTQQEYHQYFATLNELYSFFNDLEENVEFVSHRLNQLFSNQTSHYRFKTDEIHEFMNSFSKAPTRLRSPYIPPTKRSNQKVNTVEKEKILANVVRKPLKKEPIYHWISVEKADWTVKLFGKVVFETFSIPELLMYLVENNIQEVRIRDTERKRITAFLNAAIRENKKQNVELIKNEQVIRKILAS